MFWGLSKFQDLQLTLRDAANLSNEELKNSILTQMSAALEELELDLQSFSDPPKRSTASEASVKKGLLRIDEQDYEVSQEFVNMSLMLAEEFDLDEVVSAEIVFRSVAESSESDGPQVYEEAVIAMHTRIQLIIGILKTLFKEASRINERSVDESSTSYLVRWCSNSVSILNKGSKPLVNGILDALKSREEALEKQKEKLKNAKVLNRTNDDDYMRVLKIRTNSLREEHEQLGHALYYAARCGMFSPKSAYSCLEHLKVFKSFGELGAHYIPAVLAAISHFTKSPDNYTELGEIYKALRGQASNWSIPSWGNGLLLVAAGSLIAVLGSPTSKAFKKAIAADRIVDLRYDNVTRSIEGAIDHGALDFLMCLAWDISPHTDRIFRFLNYKSFFSASTDDLGISGSLTPEFTLLILKELEQVFYLFLNDVWDIVHKMKINEEDIYMARKARASNEHDKVLKTLADVQPGVDYERFLVFSASLFAGRKEAGTSFWDQRNGILHGFVQYVAMSSPSPNMMAASCVFLASISCGEESAELAFDFLQVVGTSDKTSIRINIGLILQNLVECYTKYAVYDDKAHQTDMAYYGYDVHPDTLLVTCAHLQLLTTVLIYNEPARQAFQTQKTVSLFQQKFPISEFLFGLMSNRSQLYAPIMELLSTLAMGLDPSIRRNLWITLDHFLFVSRVAPENGYIHDAMPRASVEFRMAILFPLNSLDLLDLVKLIKGYLVSPGLVYDVDTTEEAFSLPYPTELGEAYRTPGIWPYVEIIADYIFKSVDLWKDPSSTGLKLECTSFFENCLDLYNPVTEHAVNQISVTPDVQPTSALFGEYILKHPFAYVMNFLFDDRIYPNLFESLLGDATTLLEKYYDNSAVSLIIHTLGVITKVLKYEHLYFDIAVPVYSKVEGSRSQSKMQQPRKFGSHTLRSFGDAILYNLAVVPNIFIYVGSRTPELAIRSLSLLQFISLSPQFVGSRTPTRDARVKNDRLLSTILAVDERYLIRHAFIDQFTRPTDDYETVPEGFFSYPDQRKLGQDLEKVYFGDTILMTKMNLMNFLISNLERDTTSATVAHFILGFGIKGDGSLIKDYGFTGIGSRLSLIGTILEHLREGPKNLQNGECDYFSTTLLAASAKIVSLLVTRPQTSALFLSHLRDINQYEAVINVEPITSISTRWSGATFVEFSSLRDDRLCYSTLYSFYRHRAEVLTCASVEIYDAFKQGSISLIEKNINVLVQAYADKRDTFGSDPTKLLSLLDFLEFSEEDMLYIPDLDSGLTEVLGSNIMDYYSSCANLELTASGDTGERYLKVFQELFWSRYNDMKKSNISISLKRWEDVADIALGSFNQLLKTKRLVKTLSDCLESWSKLLLVVLSSQRLEISRRSSLILEVFQTIVPKFSNYASYNGRLTAILCSTLASTFHIYMSDISGNEKVQIDTNFDKTHLLFSAALRVLLMKLSDDQVRHDAYIICYLHLNHCIKEKSKEFLSKAIHAIRLSGDKLFSVVSKDILSTIITLQVPSIMFLEVIIMAGTALNTSHVLDNLIKTNLLTLLVESVVPLGQLMLRKDDVSRSELVNSYEVLMQTLCILQQISQTRAGATFVIQCGIFESFKSCGILTVDPDTKLSAESDQAGLQLTKRNVTLGPLLSGIFKVVTCIVLSLGPENGPSMKRLKAFLEDNERLTVTILRKDAANEMNDDDSVQLVNSVVLLTAISK